jgi:type IX secretion system PorP/SprF family membrane protein
MNIPENFDRWMFDYKEGNLSGAEMKAFENYLVQHPEFEVEADAWNLAFVENEEFVYPKADELEKDRKVAGGWYAWSAAAVALLLIGASTIYYLNSNGNQDGNLSTISDSNQTDMTNDELVKIDNETIDSANSSDESIESNNNQSVNNLAENHVSNSGADLTNTSFTPNPNHESNGTNTSIGNKGSLLANQNATNGSTTVQPNLSNDVEIVENLVYATNGAVNKESLNQEINKLVEGDNNSEYRGNPSGTDLDFDISQNTKYEYNAWSNKLKRFYRKIERMFDYPVGITNLRDPDLGMPQSSILAFNPGFTGGMLKPRAELTYRNQWLGADQNSQEMTLSLDNYIYQMRGGVGVMLNATDYGTGQFSDYNINLMYSPKIVLAKNVVFEPAVKVTLGALNVNSSKMTANSQFEIDRGRVLTTGSPDQMNGMKQLWYKDYGLGFVLNTKWFYAAFSADNLNNHYESVFNVEGNSTPTVTPTLMSGIIGFDYESKRRPVDKPISLSPFLAYQKYGDRQELWAGTNFRINSFIMGGSISNKKDFTASVGMKFEKFKLVYHYDQTTSTLTNESIGSHNLGIRFSGKSKKARLN